MRERPFAGRSKNDNDSVDGTADLPLSAFRREDDRRLQSSDHNEPHVGRFPGQGGLTTQLSFDGVFVWSDGRSRCGCGVTNSSTESWERMGT